MPEIPRTNKSTAHRTETGISFFNVSFCTINGANNAHAPHTSIKLNRLEPITLLTANALFPATEAVTLTASSGRLVPIATIVSPTIIDGIRRALATEELPSTKKSAPLINKTNPTSNKTIDCIIATIHISSFVFPVIYKIPRCVKRILTPSNTKISPPANSAFFSYLFPKKFPT